MKKVKTVFLTIDNWLFKLASALVFVATSVLIVTVFLQVFTRYALRSPLPWTNEVACFMLVYIVFIGAAIALRNNEHVALDPNLIKAPAPVKKGMNILASISVYLFIAMMFYFGLYITIANKDSLSEAIKISYGYLYGVLPFSAILMLIGHTARLIVKSEVKKEGEIA